MGPTLDLSDDDADQEDVTADWGAFLSALWAHNPNLRNQFSAEVDALLQRPDGEVATTWQVNPSVSWLWVLADRVQVNTSLLARLRGSRIDRPAPAEDATDTDQYYRLRSTVTVFIENSLAVNGNVGLIHQRGNEDVGPDQVERTRWSVGVGVSFRYFFFRSLR